MTVDARLAGEADLDALTRLGREMEVHYGDANVAGFDAARAAIAAALFGPRPLALGFIARSDGVAAGLAFVTILFPTKDFRPGLFIKDIYVSDRARRRGVARALMRAIANHAREQDYSRIDWTADHTNEAAIRLYDSFEARDPSKLFFRVREASYRRLID